MINELTVMLYVTNVEETAVFWETYLAFNRLSEIEVGFSTSVVLGNERGFSLQLFDREFIKQVSPEVSLETPSLMLYVTDLEAVHNKLIESNTFVSEINLHGNQAVFNFSDNENRYFACCQVE